MNGSALRPPCFGKKPIVANTLLDYRALKLSRWFNKQAKVLPNSWRRQLQTSNGRLLAQEKPSSKGCLKAWT